MSLQLKEDQGVRLAIEGCGHGTLHAIYASVAESCKQKGWPDVDLLIIGGDFQAVRNAYDLNCVSMPAKYREMCDFHEYYSGQRTAPYLTIFVGGNHEASNYLFELYYGGWVAPNIYYMGAANVLRFGPLRIASLSGIWKGYNYQKPHHERLPYNETDMKSIYHVRELDVRKLLQLKTQVDIGISHDWPKGVEWKGNWKQLFRFKQHLEPDARSGQLGSVAAQHVMNWLRPKWWFSAHLHCKYAALVDHEKKDISQLQLSGTNTEAMRVKNENEINLDDDDDIAGPSHQSVAQNDANTHTHKNADEIDLGMDNDDDDTDIVKSAPFSRRMVYANGNEGVRVTELDEDVRAALPSSFRPPPPPAQEQHPRGIVNKNTQFLALDKCLPNRHFLQLMSVLENTTDQYARPFNLMYDREWLAITRTFAIDQPLQLGDPESQVPKARPQAEYDDMIDKRRMWVDQNISDSDLMVPENFEVTAPIYDGGNWNLPQYAQVMEYPNPQTARFCKLLQIPNPFEISEAERQRRLNAGPREEPFAEGFSKKRGRGRFPNNRGRGSGNDRGRGDSRHRRH